MPLTSGSRLGPYEIIALLGAGGMGEVYRARDTKLQRDVALKILPDLFVGDSERRARFHREAQVLASLNHPNIAHIHGLEESNGVQALVMELVEGPTLADRIAEGALPLAEALRVARQIAEALQAAHDQGIVHRDLKPANVKVRDDGTVKVLDFGLAKLVTTEAGRAASDAAVSQSPTLTAPAGTMAGAILGTAPYMSPEQAKGRGVDKRSDVWAFGCVFYEMVTGRRAFAGDSVSETLAAVLMREPDWTALPADLPPGIRGLIMRCVEKDPKRRVADLSTAMYVFDEPPAPDAAVRMAQPVPLGRRVLGYAAALLVGAACAALVTSVAMRRTSPPTPQSVRFAIVPPSAQSLQISTFDRDLAIAPDGTRIVYVGGVRPRQLMLRTTDRLDGVSLIALDDSRGIPVSPFVSPDSQWVGFFDNPRNGSILKKVSIAGGAAIALCPIAGFARGASWGPNGTIVFATDDPSSGLLSVPSSGGEPTVLTRPERAQGEVDHLFPSVLPDGRAVLFTIVSSPSQPESDQVAVLDLKTGERKTLIRGGRQGEYVDGGFLVYASSGSLRAVRFDLARLEVVGDPVPIVDQVRTASSRVADVAVSRGGTLVYVPEAQTPQRSLVWVDRRGREEPIKAPSHAYAYPRLSPDGTRLAVDARDGENDIWIWDLARESLMRMPYGADADEHPLWTPDGQRIVFVSGRPGAFSIFWRPADGSGSVQRLTPPGAELSPTSVSPDGTSLVVEGFTAERDYDIGLLSLKSLSTTGLQVNPPDVDWIIKTDIGEFNGDLSPDGHWLAYQANNSGQFGQFQVYVQPFPDASAGRWQVSADGGTKPMWARNGRELFFLDRNNLLAAVAIQTSGARFNAGKPSPVLNTPYYAGGSERGRTFDVSGDGQRFLMVKDDPAGRQPASMVVVLNWADELRRLIPTGR